MTGLSAPAGPVGVDFRVGRVLSRTFDVLRRQAVGYALLCIATSMPGRLLTYFVAPPTGPHSVVYVGAHYFNFYPERFLLLPVFFASCALVPLGSAVILLATMRVLDGERPRLGTVFQQAALRFLPLLGCIVCSGLAMVGGFLLFIVPGVIAALVLSVSSQVCVAEGLGSIASLLRSAALTRGNRWRILGFFLLTAGIFVTISIAGNVAWTVFGIAGGLLDYFLGGLADAFWATAFAVLYVDLRLCREGISTERIAAVFD